jgi:toxoflavin biosynthesis protein ToxD
MSTARVARLDEVDIDSLSDRGKMELPESFAAARFDTLPSELSVLMRERPLTLAAIAEDPGASLAERYAAGTILGLVGDPRIHARAPKMVDVPGGRARIGLEASRVDEVTRRYSRYGVKRPWIAKEAPAFDLEFEPFRIGKYPVTNAEYRAFLVDSGFPELPSSWLHGTYPAVKSNHPVFTITPAAADAYVRWLARVTGRRFRLPREVEWEYAAAGPERREFPWGEEFDCERANTVELGIRASTPVGIFPSGASSFGALDMAGNVEEYVADSYWPYPGAAEISDDLYERSKSYRIARGGGFTRYEDLARCRRRHGPGLSALYVTGLRIAEDCP